MLGRGDRLDQFSSLKCPMCGGTLQGGYVVSGRWLAWSPERLKYSVADAEFLDSPYRLTLADFTARRCTACKLVLFRYPGYGAR